MLLRSREDLIMRRGFPFVIIRLPIIFAHRIVFELVPHQTPAQIGMTIEPDAIEIENLALLKLGTAPDWRERGQAGAVYAISRAHANDYLAVFTGHRIKVINCLEIPGDFLL